MLKPAADAVNWSSVDLIFSYKTVLGIVEKQKSRLLLDFEVDLLIKGG